MLLMGEVLRHRSGLQPLRLYADVSVRYHSPILIGFVWPATEGPAAGVDAAVEEYRHYFTKFTVIFRQHNIEGKHC
jgi:hypothetical protein